MKDCYIHLSVPRERKQEQDQGKLEGVDYRTKQENRLWARGSDKRRRVQSDIYVFVREWLPWPSLSREPNRDRDRKCPAVTRDNRTWHRKEAASRWQQVKVLVSSSASILEGKDCSWERGREERGRPRHHEVLTEEEPQHRWIRWKQRFPSPSG